MPFGVVFKYFSTRSIMSQFFCIPNQSWHFPKSGKSLASKRSIKFIPLSPVISCTFIVLCDRSGKTGCPGRYMTPGASIKTAAQQHDARQSLCQSMASLFVLPKRAHDIHCRRTMIVPQHLRRCPRPAVRGKCFRAGGAPAGSIPARAPATRARLRADSGATL